MRARKDQQDTMEAEGCSKCLPLLPPEGVCLHVIDFYLTLDGLIHRFNYIMCCPINTALQLFYIQPGCQIELNGFFKAYKARKYLSLVGIFYILATKSSYAKAGSKVHLRVRKPIWLLWPLIFYGTQNRITGVAPNLDISVAVRMEGTSIWEAIILTISKGINDHIQTTSRSRS